MRWKAPKRPLRETVFAILPTELDCGHVVMFENYHGNRVRNGIDVDYENTACSECEKSNRRSSLVAV